MAWKVPLGLKSISQRIFNLGEMARSDNDEAGFLQYLGQLRQAAPTSFWLQQALLSEGNYYLLKPDYDKAIDAYRELQQRFPKGGRASYAHWKVAWLSLRQGRTAEAKTGFEQQIGLYPTSAEVPAALYWRARLAEEDNDSAMARAYYKKILGALPQFLLRRTGAPPPAGNQGGRRSPAVHVAGPRSRHQRRGQYHRQRSARPTTCVIRRRKCWRTARWWTWRCESCRPPEPKKRELGDGGNSRTLRRRGTL